MSLLIWEVKKIWRPILLLAIILIGVVYYPIRPGFYLNMIGHDVISKAEIQLASEWLKQYGPTIDRSERAELDGQLTELKADFAQQLINVPGASEAGIIDYDSYLTWENAFYEKDTPTEEERTLYQSLLNLTDSYTIGELITFMNNYDRLANGGSVVDIGAAITPPSPAADASIQRILRVENNKDAYGFLPSSIVSDTDAFFHYFAIWCSFSTILLLAPTLVNDRLHHTRPMQWVSRRGRKVINMQMGSALISGLLLTMLNCIAYLLPFLSTEVLQFWNCPMVSVWPGSFPWFDWSYGQYLLALLSLTTLLTLATAGFITILSWYSGNYVSVLLKAIPLIFVLEWVVVPWIMDGAGRFASMPVRLTGWPGTEFMGGILTTVLSLFLCIFICQRQKKKDLSQ